VSRVFAPAWRGRRVACRPAEHEVVVGKARDRRTSRARQPPPCVSDWIGLGNMKIHVSSRERADGGGACSQRSVKP